MRRRIANNPKAASASPPQFPVAPLVLQPLVWSTCAVQSFRVSTALQS